jgi:hypothetical protein
MQLPQRPARVARGRDRPDLDAWVRVEEPEQLTAGVSGGADDGGSHTHTA